MLLFCGSKVFRHSGKVSAFDISIGPKIEQKCCTLFFNDGTQCIVPYDSKLSIMGDLTLKVNPESKTSANVYRKKYRLKPVVPEFSNKIIDPYLIGLGICAKLKNKSLYLKKYLDTSNFNAEYFSFDLVKDRLGYKISSKDGYPNLLPLEIKKIDNFRKLSERFIPDEYLFSDYFSRSEILRACMDVYGKYSKAETTFETCSYQLANDVMFLVRSLGGFAKLRIKKSVKDYFIVNISFRGEFNPFKFSGKNYRKNRKPRVKSIDAVEPAGILPCFEVPIDKIILENLIELVD